jgi:hypothetical protein
MDIMSRFVIALAVVAMTVTGLGLAANAEQDDAGTACPPEQMLVKVRSGADPAEVVARHGGTILSTISGIEVQVVAVPAGTLSQKLDEMNADPDVQYAEANSIVRISEPTDGASCSPASPPPSPTGI